MKNVKSIEKVLLCRLEMSYDTTKRCLSSLGLDYKQSLLLNHIFKQKGFKSLFKAAEAIKTIDHNSPQFSLEELNSS